MPADLIAACWTSAGACDARPDTLDDRSPLPIGRRVAAVAAAGFAGFGIRHGDLLTVERETGFPAFRRMLDDHGLRILELEFLEGWFLPRDDLRRAASDAARADFVRAANRSNGGKAFIVLPSTARSAQERWPPSTRATTAPLPFTSKAETA